MQPAPLKASYQAKNSKAWSGVATQPVSKWFLGTLSQSGFEVGNDFEGRPEKHVRKPPFAAVRNKHPRGYELPEEKDATPNEGDGHNGLRSRSVARISCRHLKDVTGSNIAVGENIREN